MELVDGLTLDELIRQKFAVRGATFDIAEVISIARQIADALEVAHDLGIVHRDLKPANVKVRADGTVKVLDFGLAKAFGSRSPNAAPGGAESPTVTCPAMTEQGVILGTAAYMAPEQARGQVVDKRADIWAFGAVLYELLTGRRAFAGDTFSDVLAAVLRQEIDWSRLPADTPPRLRQLLERCLERDVKQRLRDIGEARIALAAIALGGSGASGDARAAVAQPRPSRERLAWTVAALAIVAAATLFALQRMGVIGPTSPVDATDVVRLSVLPPPGLVMNPDSTNVAISPNGRMVAFVVGAGVSTENQLWVRSLDSPIARRIEGGDGVAQPFWSPTSERIGFFADGKLKTVAAAGGPSEPVCDAPFGRGATWNASNVIVFAPDSTGPLYRVSANKGTPAVVTALDPARKETGHRFPLFLPDGDHFLYAALPGGDGTAEIFAGSLRDPRAKTLIGSMESAPAYVDPGWLIFTRDGVLAAQPFDTKRLQTTGEAVSLGDEPDVAPGSAAYDAGRRVSASLSGSLAYFLEPAANTNVEWIDQSGKITATVGVPAGRYTAVALAPDRTRAILVRRNSGIARSMWLVDLTRESAVPLSVTVGRLPSPVWSPDSTRFVFEADRDGHHELHEKTLADSSPERRMLQFANPSAVPTSWSKNEILFTMIEPGLKWNVYRLPTSGAAEPVALVRGPAIEGGGALSPDGHALAYLSDETGRMDVFVQSFPIAGATLQIPTGGTQRFWWTLDSRHLLFLKRDHTLWRAEVDMAATPPRAGAPQQLGTFPPNLADMDLSSDDQRFLAIVPERAGVGTVTIVQSWRAALAKR